MQLPQPKSEGPADLREAAATDEAAFYQLVLYPAAASATLTQMYVTAAQNRLYAAQDRAATNPVRALFERDAVLTQHYHEDMANGKWDQMMSQAHVGDTGSWRAPQENTMPEVHDITLPQKAEMGVAIEGSTDWWPRADTPAVLPPLHRYGRRSRFIEVFNRGRVPYRYTTNAAPSWLEVTPAQGRVDQQQRVRLNVSWADAPAGRQRVPITVSRANGQSVTIEAVIVNPISRDTTIEGFVESNGYVSIDAAHYSKAVEAAPVRWTRIPNLGRTGSAVTPTPTTASPQDPGGRGRHLAYNVYLSESDSLEVRAHLSPTLDYRDTGGLRSGISIDDGPTQIVNMHEDTSHTAWQRWVSNNVNVMTSTHHVDDTGKHTVKFWMVDPGIVLQKHVLDLGGLAPSYLGPPKSHYRPAPLE